MIESRFYIGENESITTEKNTNHAERRFGTKLSANTTDNGKDKTPTPKKIVRVRRAISSSKSKEKKNHSLSKPASDEVVVFPPGPVGLQLEPNHPYPGRGCKIVRFVDGGPKNPGQARKSGKLKPGDLITKVETNNGVVGSSYDDIVEILKDSCATRTVTFHSVWKKPFLESHKKSGVKNRFKRDTTPERPLTPNTHNLSSAKFKNSTPKEPSRKFETLLPPPFLLGSAQNHNEKEESGHDSRFDITLIQSPSHAALLPHVRTPLQHSVRSPQVRSPPSHESLCSPSYLPRHLGGNKDIRTIIDLGDRLATPPVLPPIPSWSVPRPSSRQSPCYLIPRRITSEAPKHHVGELGTPQPQEWVYYEHSSPFATDAKGQILSVDSYPSISAAKEIKKSPSFSPSSVRRLSKIENKDEDSENPIMARVFGRLCTSAAPIVASSSSTTRSWNSAITGSLNFATMTHGDDWNASKSHGCDASTNAPSSETEGLDYIKAQVLRELRYMKIAKDVEDIATQEAQRSIEENKEEKGLLKLEFNEMLHVAKAQHTAAENKLKDLCKRQESEILVLETKLRKLEDRLKDSRGTVSVENINLSTVQETLHRTMGKLESKRKEADELSCKNGLVQERVSELEGALETFREKEKSLLLELEMTRTMTKEMERRLLEVEASSAESVKALQNHLVEREEELKTTQALVSKLKQEESNLLNHMDSLESGVKALQNENGELRWELDRKYKELSESKNEISTIHETLLQNLENGASRADEGLGCDDLDGGNIATSLGEEEKMDDATWYRASRCALVVFMIREKIFEEKYSEHINKLDMFNNDLLISLGKSLERARQDDVEFRKRDMQMLTLKRQHAEEMENALRKETERRNQECDENFKHLLKVGISINPQLMDTNHHLISTMRINTEVSQAALSRTERYLERCTSQFQQRLNLCHSHLQISMDSENSLKSKLDATMEKLARTSIKLRHIEEEKTENETSLLQSEEALSQAVKIIKKLEAAVAAKDRRLDSVEAQINALKENEEVLSSEHMGLCEKMLGLEERLTISTEKMCKLRRARNSLESQNAVLETKLQTMKDQSVDITALALEKEELQQNVSSLKDQLKNCRAELELASVTSSLLESDMMELVDKSEEQRRRELSKMELLLLEVSCEREMRRALQQKLLETAQMLESFKQKHLGLQVAFLASLGAGEAKSQCLLNLNKNLERLICDKTRDTEVLEHKVLSSQIQIENLTDERQSLHAEILQLKHIHAAETQDLRCEIEVLENALDSSNTEHVATRANLQKANNMLLGVSAQRDALQSEISEALNQKETHIKDVRNLRQEVSLLTITARKAHFRYCAASAAIEGMNRFFSQSAEDIAQKKSLIVSLADQICSIEGELRNIEDNYELENCLLHKNIDEQRRTICALVAASIAEHIRSREINARVGDFKATILEIQTELDCARSKLLLAEADRLGSLEHKNENEILKKKLRALETKVGGLEKEFISKTEEVCSLRVCIAVEQDKIFHSTQMFEAERKRLLATTLEMAQEILKLKGDVDDIQEDHINELEGTKILLEDLRRERDSIVIALEELKKDSYSEKQRNLTYKKELDSLQRSCNKLHSEKLIHEARICQQEKTIGEHVEKMNMCQRESSEWRSKAKSFESQTQEMTMKYRACDDEIVSLHEVNETLLNRLNTIAVLKRQQKSNESDLKSHEFVMAKLKEEREKALLERHEANFQLDVLQNTTTQLREKVETLTKEKDRLLSDRCITEAALAGLRRQSDQGIRFLNNMKGPNISIGGMEGPYTNHSSMYSIESIPSDQHSRSQEQIKHMDIGIAVSNQTRNGASNERTAGNLEVPLPKDKETRELVNRIGNEVVGARLLSLVFEQRTRMGVAGAFRKWSCANNAMKATSQLHRTSRELSHQLHCTREKLLVLKSHIKANSMQTKENEPRLRMVLKQINNV